MTTPAERANLLRDLSASRIPRSLDAILRALILDSAEATSIAFADTSTFDSGDSALYREALYAFTAAKRVGAWNSYKTREIGRPEELKIAFAATGSIVGYPAVLRRLKILSGATLTLVLRDSSNAAADTTIFTSSGLSGATSEIKFGPRGYHLVNGLYATVTGTGIFEVSITP